MKLKAQGPVSGGEAWLQTVFFGPGPIRWGQQTAVMKGWPKPKGPLLFCTLLGAIYFETALCQIRHAQPSFAYPLLGVLMFLSWGWNRTGRVFSSLKDVG